MKTYTVFSGLSCVLLLDIPKQLQKICSGAQRNRTGWGWEKGRPGQSGAFQYPQLKAYTAMMTTMWVLITIIILLLKTILGSHGFECVALAVSTYFTVSWVALRSSYLL